jgi:glucose/arabinose dehydrogenase
LPAGPINYHWTRNLIAEPDETLLYVTVGSNSNIGENGMEREAGRAAVWRVDPAQPQASYLRFRPAQSRGNGLGAGYRGVVDGGQRARRTGQRPGARLPDPGAGGRFYGWPYSYFGRPCG